MSLTKVLRSAAIVLGSALLVACAGGADDEDTDATSDELNATTQRTVCFAGRTWGDPMSSGGIPEIDSVCRAMPNLIRDLRGPDAAYNFFQWNSSLAHELDVVVAALDTNHDGRVTKADAPVTLNVVGYSWGGFNALDFIEAMETDARFAPERRTVARYFALDAFRTDWLVMPRADLEVPANVQKFYSFRHSVAPEKDCSIILGGLVGPFTGRTPYCTGTTECHDFDYSLVPATRGVDHCTVPTAAKSAILAFVANKLPTGLPSERYVERY